MTMEPNEERPRHTNRMARHNLRPLERLLFRVGTKANPGIPPLRIGWLVIGDGRLWKVETVTPEEIILVEYRPVGDATQDPGDVEAIMADVVLYIDYPSAEKRSS